MVRPVLLLRLATFGLILGAASGKSVVGFAAIGATSHQSAIASIGLELVRRGHNFTMLLSSGDVLSQARFSHDPFKTLKQLTFSGPPKAGTEAWLNQIKRDPQEASVLQLPSASLGLE